MKWQPIETAPMDGTPFRACSHGTYHGMEFMAQRRGPQYPGDVYHWWSIVAGHRMMDHAITHWQSRDPLPAPPE